MANLEGNSNPCQPNKISSLGFFKLQLKEQKYSLISGKSIKVWGTHGYRNPCHGVAGVGEDAVAN